MKISEWNKKSIGEALAGKCDCGLSVNWNFTGEEYHGLCSCGKYYIIIPGRNHKWDLMVSVLKK